MPTIKIKASGSTLELLRDVESLRGRFGWSTDETAARLGVTGRTYRNWLAGKSEPPFSVVDKVARMCRAKPAAVYEGMHRELQKAI